MRVQIIAEIGINHGGDMDMARWLIKQAKDAGADVAKFQFYDPEKTLNKKDFFKDDWFEIKGAELSFEEVAMLKGYCDGLNIEFMASAFDPIRLKWLEELNVDRHKIASRMIFDKEYVKLVRATGKPYLVSMGWMTLEKCNEYGESILSMRNKFIKTSLSFFLYCISKYPTSLEEVNITKDIFDSYNFDGFSDHTVGITAAITAIVMGAKIIEKHFTYDRKAPGPDHVCSIEQDELLALCEFRDEFEILSK